MDNNNALIFLISLIPLIVMMAVKLGMGIAPPTPPKKKPFPWRCRKCGLWSVELDTAGYEAEVRNNGVLHKFFIPDLIAPTCMDNQCRERVFTDEVMAQIYREFIEYLRTKKTSK